MRRAGISASMATTRRASSGRTSIAKTMGTKRCRASPSFTYNDCHQETVIRSEAAIFRGRTYAMHYKTTLGPLVERLSWIKRSYYHSGPSPLSEVVRRLAQRLEEPIPLRASATSNSHQRERRTELVEEIVERYPLLPALDGTNSQCERFRILEFLAIECAFDTRTAADRVGKNRSTNNQNQSDFRELKQIITPVYETMMDVVLQQNALQGMKLIVHLREDTLHIKRRLAPNEPHYGAWKELDDCLRSILKRWFVKGILVHERITYESSPASVIEAIAKAEAVHPMQSLNDLKQRLSPRSMRVFGLFHPLLPNRLLVVVHAALLQKIPDSMAKVVPDPSRDAADPKVAAFYSISNGVTALAGVGLGELLLKESICALQREHPSLSTFVTLSPIPGFRKWIQVQCLQTKDILSSKDQQALVDCGLVSTLDPFSWEEFEEALESFEFRNTEQSQVLETILLRLVSRYLVLEKHRGMPLDKVCRFHVSNGAEIHAVRFQADLSRGGLSKSYGIMVNYLYNTKTLERNQRQYESDGFTVQVGSDVQKWLDG